MHIRMYRELVAEQWAAWVNQQLADRGWKASDAADATGIHESTIGRWKNNQTQDVKAEQLRRFAEAVGAPVLEACIAAGYLSAEEAGTPPVPTPSLAEFGTVALADELRARCVKFERLGVVEADVDDPGEAEEPRRAQ